MKHDLSNSSLVIKTKNMKHINYNFAVETSILDLIDNTFKFIKYFSFYNHLEYNQTIELFIQSFREIYE